MQAIAEKKLVALKPSVERVLSSEPMTEELFLATLAALEMLDGKSPVDFDKTPAAKYVIPILKSSLDQPAIAMQAIRLSQPKESLEVAALLAGVITGNYPLTLRQEAIRTLSTSPTVETIAALVKVANDSHADESLRQWAFLGLANQPSIETSWWTTKWLDEKDTPLATSVLGGLKPRIKEPAVSETLASSKIQENHPLLESIALALSAGAGDLSPQLTQLLDHRPRTAADWTALAADAKSDDSAAVARGMLIFSHPNGPGCIKCHRLEGRGGLIGPDLSHVGSTFSTDKLVTSILDPQPRDLSTVHHLGDDDSGRTSSHGDAGLRKRRPDDPRERRREHDRTQNHRCRDPHAVQDLGHAGEAGRKTLSSGVARSCWPFCDRGSDRTE